MEPGQFAGVEIRLEETKPDEGLPEAALSLRRVTRAQLGYGEWRSGREGGKIFQTEAADGGVASRGPRIGKELVLIRERKLEPVEGERGGSFLVTVQ